MSVNYAAASAPPGYRAWHDRSRDKPRDGPVVVTALTLGGVLLLGMAVTAGYAARVLPPGSRVPLNAGVPEHSVWLPKRAGLAAWFGAGVVAFAVFAVLTASGLAANWAQSVRVVLLPCVMAVVLAAEAGAVIVARRSAAGEPGSETSQAPTVAPEDVAPEDVAAGGDSASPPVTDLPKRTPGTSGNIKAHNTNTSSDAEDNFSRFGENNGSDHDTVTSDHLKDGLLRPALRMASFWDRCSRQCLEGHGQESATAPKMRAAALLNGTIWP